MVLLSACADKKPEPVKIVIPGPPEEPRIFFDAVYRGEISFFEESTLDALIGEKVSVGRKNLAKPYGVAAADDVVYVSDTALGVVLAMDEKAKKVSMIGAGSPGKLSLPVGIAIDHQKRIYVSDSKAAKVYVYNQQGRLLNAFGKSGEFNRPTGLAIDNERQRLYIVDTKAHDIKVYSLDGEKLFVIGKRGIKEGEFNFPTNVAVDRRNGNIAVVDTQNFRVQLFDSKGEFLMKFGKVGDKAGMFARPKGIGIDSDGNMYVADSAFNNIQVFNEKGELLIYFGGTGREVGRFSLITGVYIDENDRIYIVDGFNARVQIFQYVSEAWKSKHPDQYKALKEF